MRFDDGRERTALRKGRPGGLRAAFATLGSVLLLVVTTRLRIGARLEVTDRSEGDWVFVRARAGGHEGWVSRRELDAKAFLVQESG